MITSFVTKMQDFVLRHVLRYGGMFCELDHCLKMTINSKKLSSDYCKIFCESGPRGSGRRFSELAGALYKDPCKNIARK